MHRTRWAVAAGLSLVLSAGNLASTESARAAAKAVLVSDRIPPTVIAPDQTGIVYRTVKLLVDYRPPRKGAREVRLSSTSDGSGDILTDDVMVIRVEPEKGSASRQVFDFSSGCTRLQGQPAQRITGMFNPGRNLVTLALRDGCGSSYGSEAYWLVGALSVLRSDVGGQWGPGSNPGRSGDPVDTFSGNFSAVEVDVPFAPAARGLEWARTYNSADSTAGSLGPGWSSAFSERLVEGEDGTLTLITDGGRRLGFEPAADGSYIARAPFDGTVRKLTAGRFEIQRPPGDVRQFDAQGRLTGQSSPDARTLDVRYDPDDRIAGVSGPVGRSLTFTYGSDGLLARATADDGRSVAYAYSDGYLEAVTDPTGAVTRYAYDDDGRLSQVVDADGRVRLTLVYDGEGRVKRQDFPGGEVTAFNYGPGVRTTTVIDEVTDATVVFEHDEHGQLVSLTDPFGSTVERRYDSTGRLVDGTGRDGGLIRNQYGESGLIVEENGGAVTRYTYDASDRVVTTVDPLGAETHYAYEGSARLASVVTGPDGAITRIARDGDRVAAVVDPDGVQTAFTYDERGNLLTLTDGAGNVTRFEYDAVGRRAATVLPTGARTAYRYDDAGRLLEHINPTAGVSRYAYSRAGRLVEAVDPTGATVRYVYDEAGRLSATTDPLGATTAYTYDEAGHLIARTAPDGAVNRTEYDSLGRVVAESSPTGAVVRHRYGLEGERVATEDALGGETLTEYDERGNVVAGTDQTGATTRYHYDLADRLVGETDATGAERVTIYDAAGRIIAETDPRGATTRFRWTAAGRLTQVEDPLGRKTHYAYDAAGRLRSTTSPLGGVLRYEYDPDGRIVTETSPLGLSRRFTYDPAGRRVSVTGAAGDVERTEYSSRGEVLARTGATGGVRRFEYDHAGRLAAATDANGVVTRFGYDPAGRRTSLTDGRGEVTRFAYDADGREIERIDPLGRTRRQAWDRAGRLVRTELASGVRVERTYDAAGRLLSREGGGARIGFSYDAVGRRVTMSDGRGVSAYRYDRSGNPVAATDPTGAAIETTWDAAGQVTATRYPTGRSVSFRYDPDGNLAELATAPVQRSAGAVPPVPRAMLPKTIAYREAGLGGSGGAVLDGAPPNLVYTLPMPEEAAVRTTFAVDLDGHLLEERLPGLTRAYGYQAGRLVRFSQTLSGQPVQETTIERDPGGRVTAETTGGRVTRFSYDAADQLTAVEGGSATAAFTYDADGNRLSAGPAGRPVTYRYDAANQLIESRTGSAVTRYRYDADGQLVEEAGPQSTTALRYDGFGGLASATTGSGGRVRTTTYGRDGDGLIVSLETTSPGRRAGAGGPGHRFVWGTVDGLAQILTQSGSDSADFVYGYHRTLALVGGEAIPFAVDRVGSAVATRPTRPWVQAAGYGVFGETLNEGASPAPVPRFGYRGELTVNRELHLRARVYDPAAGRFTTVDPLDGVPGETVAANPYHYSGNDPRNRVDPLGLRPTDADIDRGLAPSPILTPPPWVTLPPLIAPPVPVPPPSGGGLLSRFLTRAGGVAVLVIADVLLDARAAGSPDEEKLCVYCEDGPRVTWRGGSSTNQSLTPRPVKDVDGYPQNGLSTWLTQPEACIGQTKGSALSVDLLSAAPGLRLQSDERKPSHVFVQGATKAHHFEWAASRPAAELAPHRLTRLVEGSIVARDVPCPRP